MQNELKILINILTMGKSFRKFKGEKVQQKERKKHKERKYFGETSGSHSKGVYEREVVDDGDGGITIKCVKTDKAPQKNVDFIKYGYPLEMRRKNVILNKIVEDELEEQIKELNQIEAE